VEQRVSVLEAQVQQLATVVQDLVQQAGALRDRHTLLEERMVKGLEDLGRALDAVNARRPPMRRKLQEVEDRLEAAGIPQVPETPAPAEGGGE
jgi:hypothetical protein